MNCSEAASSTSKKPRKSQSSRHSANSRASALHVLNIRYFGCPVPEHRIPLQGLAYRLRSGWARAVRFVYSVCVSSPDRSRCSASAETPSGRHPGFAVGDVNVSSLRGSVAARERTCSLRVPLLPRMSRADFASSNQRLGAERFQPSTSHDSPFNVGCDGSQPF
jgi:hypothetical protein